MKKTIIKVLCLVIVSVMAVACFASCGSTVNYAENNTTIKTFFIKSPKTIYQLKQINNVELSPSTYIIKD